MAWTNCTSECHPCGGTRLSQKLLGKGREFEKELIFKGNHVRGLGVGQIGAGKMREDAESNFGKSCPIGGVTNK